MMRGYSGYTAPGYLAGEKSYPAPPHHLLSLLTPEALTGLLERIKAGGGLGGVSRMGQGDHYHSPLGLSFTISGGADIAP